MIVHVLLLYTVQAAPSPNATVFLIDPIVTLNLREKAKTK
jgi:hypothetical protein